MIILSKEQILKIHASLIEATGGSAGIRDEGMLDLALNNPFQFFWRNRALSECAGKSGKALFWIGKKSCYVRRKQKTWCARDVGFSVIKRI